MDNMTTEQFSREIDPAIRKRYVDGYKATAPELEKVFIVESQTDYNEQESETAGLPSLPVVGENETIPRIAPIPVYGTTYTPVAHKALVDFSREFQQYDKSGIASAGKIAELKGKASARTVGSQGSSVWNNGFSTSYTSFGDGKPLFSTDHTRADGGSSIVNASSTGIALTEENLYTAMVALENMLDHQGQLIDIYADTLLVPNELRKTAAEIIMSDKKSGTADNDTNAYQIQTIKGVNLDKMHVWKYLSSATAWFLLSEGNHLVKWKWSVKPKLDRDDSIGFANETIVYRIVLEASTGWSGIHGIYGSKGDGQAYGS